MEKYTVTITVDKDKVLKTASQDPEDSFVDTMYTVLYEDLREGITVIEIKPVES